MSTAPTEPLAMHRAALVLHGLTDADRAWVLQALPVEQQRSLQPLLQELGELGIPRDAALFGPLVERRPAEEPDPGVALLERLAEGEIARLALLLAAAPPRLAAVLLAARPWSWRERLLQRLPAALVVQMRSAPPPGDAMQAAVIAQVARQLQADPRATPRRRAWWNRLAAGLPLALPGIWR